MCCVRTHRLSGWHATAGGPKLLIFAPPLLHAALGVVTNSDAAYEQAETAKTFRKVRRSTGTACVGAHPSNALLLAQAPLVRAGIPPLTIPELLPLPGH